MARRLFLSLVGVAVAAEEVRFNGTQLNLANPFRGFRLETTLGDGPDGNSAVEAEIALARKKNISVINTYTYLDVGEPGHNLTRAPIDAAKLRWIERDLKQLEEAGMATMMVFSYLRGKSHEQLHN